jgi:hypothetical protein
MQHMSENHSLLRQWKTPIDPFPYVATFATQHLLRIKSVHSCLTWSTKILSKIIQLLHNPMLNIYIFSSCYSLQFYYQCLLLRRVSFTIHHCNYGPISDILKTLCPRINACVVTRGGTHTRTQNIWRNSRLSSYLPPSPESPPCSLQSSQR